MLQSRRFGLCALVLLSLISLPDARAAQTLAYPVMADDAFCAEVDSLQSQMIDATGVHWIQMKHERIAQMKSRIHRAFAPGIFATREYLSSLDQTRKDQLFEFENNTSDGKAALAELGPPFYGNIESEHAKKLEPYRKKYQMSQSRCSDKGPETACVTDGNKQGNVERTIRFADMWPQFYVQDKPAVISCNYDRSKAGDYLREDELTALSDKEYGDPELASYFATDLGWKNACLRIPFKAKADDIIFDPDRFAERVAKAIWRVELHRRFVEMNDNFDRRRIQMGCAKGLDGEPLQAATDAQSKPSQTGEMPKDGGEVLAGTAVAGGASVEPVTTPQ